MSSGKVTALFKARKGQKTHSACQDFHLDAQGIIGDKHHGKNAIRSILLTSLADSYTLAKENGIDVPLGSLGENIIIDIPLYHLHSGDRLQIGSAVIEITQNCTLCSSLGEVNPKLPDLLKDNRGIFGKTVQNGTIRKDDIVTLL